MFAQWRSSTRTARGRCAARHSRNRRQAVKDSLCSTRVSSPIAPTSGPSRETSHSCSESPPRVSDSRLELLNGLVRAIGFEDARLGLDDLAQRPERDSLPVGKTATLPPADPLRPVVQPTPELSHEPRLPHSRLARDRDELNGLLSDGAGIGILEKDEVVLPPDERGFGAASASTPNRPRARTARQWGSGSSFP